MIEFNTEITFPVSEALSVGLLFAAGQLFGVILGNNNNNNKIIIYLYINLIKFIVYLFFLKR